MIKSNRVSIPFQNGWLYTIQSQVLKNTINDSKEYLHKD